jgi:sulfite reductase alpha subunit-like flavoprotein
MKKFWNFIMRKDLPDNSLANLNYTIFGLGDRSYEKFNSIATLLDKRVSHLGAHMFHSMGLGDEQQDFGYETEFDPWLLSLVDCLNDIFGKSLVYKELPHTPMYETIVLDKQPISDDIYNIDNLYKGVIMNFNKLTSEDSIRTVFHLELADINNVELKYTHGDVAVVYPRNQTKDVETMLDILGLQNKTIVEIRCLKDGMKNPFPRYITVGELLQRYVNICSIPNRYFCKIASRFTKNDIHREKLELFATKTAVSIY